MSSAPIRLTGAVVTGGEIISDGAVLLDGATVAFVGAAADLPASARAVPTPPAWRRDLTILPGLVDIHCHGGAGGEFGADVAGGRRAAAHHLAHGTTTLVGSIASRTPQDLLDAVAVCAQLSAEGHLVGIHLEGPFLAEARKGAQNPAALCDADLALLQAAADKAADRGGTLLHLTYAPERDPHGVLPEALAALDVLGAIGHTDTDAATTYRALSALGTRPARGGRPVVTHLFNGMPPLHHRAPGPVAAALSAAARGDAVVELIGDGVHLAPETVRMVFDAAGPEAIALVTDAMAACGMPDGGYHLGGLEVVVSEGVARLRDGSSIAGGTATLLDVLRWTVLVAGVPLVEAARAATQTPAEALALPAGELATGRVADVLVLDPDLHATHVLRGGALVAQPAAREERP